MDWIKKHYDQFLLLLLSIALLGLSIWLIMNALSFNSIFTKIQEEVPRSKEVDPVELQSLKQAQDAVATPTTWRGSAKSLFVSVKYLVKDDKLEDPRKPGALPIHDPVPNEWFDKYKLELLANNALTDDPDKDGFSNLDEWKGGVVRDPAKETDPTKADSHPAYYTKLCVKQVIKRPFRLQFASYTGDEYQINTLDVRQPTQFLKINDPIAGTKFKIIKFEEKHFVDPNGVEIDNSELTIQNVETSENVVLVLGKIGDSPDSFALFRYRWDNTEFPVKKDGKFGVKPEEDVQYKLVDIKEAGALIENLKTGEKIDVARCDDVRR